MNGRSWARGRNRHRAWILAVASVFTVVSLLMSTDQALASTHTKDTKSGRTAQRQPKAVQQKPPQPKVVQNKEKDPRTVASEDRNKVLGSGWRRSRDRVWATSGDANGFHILVAEAHTGYFWRTVTSLSEPGFDTDRWIGNSCVTASGRKLMVTYAPRTFTNRPELFARGGFTAIVDLSTGAVVKLPIQATLAYFSPGCGAGETVVFTQAGEADRQRTKTKLSLVDARTSRVARQLVVNGEVTSAIPRRDGSIVAADSNRVVRIDAKGKRTRLAKTNGIPFRLTTGSTGAVTYIERQGQSAKVRRVEGKSVRTLATGDLRAIDLVASAEGRAYLTGSVKVRGSLPADVRKLPANNGARPSSTGETAITQVDWLAARDPRIPVLDPAAPRQVGITMKSIRTGRTVAFRLTPGDRLTDRAGTGRRTHPVLADSRASLLAGSPTDPVEAERTCSVPRNDPVNQVLQPKPRQVEWAVDQAVRNVLTVQRPAGWKNLGMPAYIPQGLFPPVALDGGGYVPAQIVLGVAAQESNLWQASSHAIPGVTGNPLIGNYYGRSIYDTNPDDDWDIHWDKADCGYGVMQLTDRMRLAGKEKPGTPPALPYQTQRAVALDFAANVAAGVQLLETKWNETRRAGLIVNGGESQYLENWFFAVWAYNSGFHPQSEAAANDGAWGVGWANNPANPHYLPNREPFLEKSYEDAKNPQFWPYPEKVMGWAGHPVEVLEAPNTLVAGYRAAWWPGGSTTGPINRAAVKPPMNLFCDSTNQCEPGAKHQPNAPGVGDEPSGPCAHKNAAEQFDLKCWYHGPVTWKENCDATCGRELLRFDPGYAYQEDGTAYPPNCDVSGLPSGTRIIDDVPDSVLSVRPNCPRTWTNAGTFGLTFASDSYGNFPSKVDFHQLGGGFGGHFWFAHTRKPAAYSGKMRVTGTWRLSQPMSGWTRIKVHLPQQGAWTRQADYSIQLGNGKIRHRVVNQAWQAHTWVDLGVFNLAGNAAVVMNTETSDGRGEDNMAFDAVAFIPTVKPAEFYVAMGDSYSAGEGVEPYDTNSDYKRIDGSKDACHRSTNGAYAKRVTIPGHTEPIAKEAQTGAGTTAFAFIACSGALTTSVATEAVNSPPSADDAAGHTVWGNLDQHWGEVAQADQGYLDEDTTLVTISIGGNDARYSDILKGCIFVNPTEGCYADSYRLERLNGVVDPAPLNVYEKNVILELLPGHLETTYRAIHARAPNARIIVVGYPNFFPDNPVEGCYGITPETQKFMNSLGSMLTISIANTVDRVRATGVNIGFVDPTPHWRRGTGQNSHWACPTSPSGTWTNAVINWSETGSGRDVPGTGSFHPKLEGQIVLADLVNLSLLATSSELAVQTRIQDYVATRASDGWTITPDEALDAAHRCLALTRKAGVVGNPCMTQPILFPTVNNAKGAAINDDNALVANPAWVMLNYVSNAEKGKVLARDWMDRVAIKQTTCTKPRPTGEQCDEYPFYSSELGGAWDFYMGHENSPVSTKLKSIPTGENRAEGVMVGAMYTKCQMTSGTYDATTKALTGNGSPYLTVPMLDPSRAPVTFYIC